MDREWKKQKQIYQKNEREQILAGVERRKQLQNELRELKKLSFQKHLYLQNLKPP